MNEAEARAAICDLHWWYLERHSTDPQTEDEKLHAALDAYRTAVRAAMGCYRVWEYEDVTGARGGAPCGRCPSCAAGGGG